MSIWYNTSIVSLAMQAFAAPPLAPFGADALLYHFAKMPLRASIFVRGIIYAIIKMRRLIR